MQPSETLNKPKPGIKKKISGKKSRLQKAIGTTLWVLFLVFATFVGTIYGWISKSKVAVEIIKNINVPPKETFGKDSLNLLILGCDENLAPGGKKVLKAAGRADMILLTHLDFDRKTITGISIPRDTKTQLPGGPVHKLNAYHNLAKPSEADALQQQAVEQLTGVKVDKTIVIDYLAFQQLVDAVGGVKVNIKTAMKYTDVAGGLYIDFKPGPKTLDGYDAMCYVRFRKGKGGSGGGDFVRTERQRQFLIAFKSQIVKNWMNLPEIIELGVKVLGSSVQAKEVAALATFAKSVPQTNITMTRMPTKRGRGSFEEIDESKAKKMFDTYGFNGREHEPKESEQDSKGATKRAKEHQELKKQELG